MPNNKCFTNTIIMASLVFTLVACGGSGEKGKTQVAARVNGQEITIYQINQVLGSGDSVATGPNSGESANLALDSIIGQTVILQKAGKAKFDRDPAVLQAIESAKQSVLLNAYLARSLPKVPQPSADKVQSYYKQHPELFAQRRIYIYNQLNVPAGKQSVASLTEKISTTQKLDQFTEWLKAQGVDYSLMADAKPAEQLPMLLLARLQNMNAGDLGYMAVPGGLVVMGLQQVISQPLSEEQARPLIERHLVSQAQQEAAHKMLKELRDAAKIEYLGDFKPVAQAGKTMQQPTPSAKSPESQPAKDNSHIVEGLKGL